MKVCSALVANFSFPGGAHIAEVEIDPDTCIVKLVNYTAVDDIGTVMNPFLRSAAAKAVFEQEGFIFLIPPGS